MITEDYVSRETAKLLKEKGFEGVVNAYYHIWDNGNRVCSVQEFSHSEAPHLYFSAPTLQMAMKWLRGKYNILIEIRAIKPYTQDVLLRSAVPLDGIKYHASIVWIDNWNEDLREFKWKGITPSDTYEQVCEAAIKYCLKSLV